MSLLALWAPLAAAQTVGPDAWTLAVNVEGRRLTGFPLEASEKRIYLLQRDGRIEEFSPEGLTEFQKISSTFRPLSAGEMRSELLKEVSPYLEVSGTGHYLVAHPKGQGDKWAKRFEELYRSMVHYFAKRGFTMQEPEFPLVAIVWGKHEDFLRYASGTRQSLPPGVLGYYAPMDNRITLYDMARGKSDAQAWQQNAATIVHEATHQTAFNTGLHRRMADTPKWIVEGMGTLFEARGVWDSRLYPAEADRINRGRLEDFRRYQQAGRPALGFLGVVRDDRLFNLQPGAAYAESWALTFYLSEKEPARYRQLLARTAQLEPFTQYRSEQRLADFTQVFGNNLELFEANYLRFIAGLK